MRISLFTPTAPSRHTGNRITAARWAGIFRELGHTVHVTDRETVEPADLLIGLHLRKSATAVADFRDRYPKAPVIVALTGTDIYQDLPRGDRHALFTLEAADLLIGLQPNAPAAIPEPFRQKVEIILQSAPEPVHPPARSIRTFDVAILSHLRSVKDPLRTAFAARRLPSCSKVRILHAGAALDDRWQRRAEEEQKRNPRYRWFGDLPHWKAMLLLGRSRLMVLSSRLEGAATVLSEAVASGTPILAARNPGSEGVLGAGHPGLFRCGDDVGLALMLDQAENSPAFLRKLRAAGNRLRPALHPRREIAAWKQVFRDRVFLSEP